MKYVSKIPEGLRHITSRRGYNLVAGRDGDGVQSLIHCLSVRDSSWFVFFPPLLLGWGARSEGATYHPPSSAICWSFAWVNPPWDTVLFSN